MTSAKFNRPHNPKLKTKTNMDTIFTHRPLAGVSAGAFSTGSRLFVAFSFVNDGSSRNGIFWDDRQDTFSRSTARAIINGRLSAAQAGDKVPMTFSFETDMTSRQFIAAFRQTFKPTPDETDDFLSAVASLEDGEDEIEVRFRPFAEALVDKMAVLAEEVVANASASV